MKKVLLQAAFLIAALSANAQNIQFHHDFGRVLYPDELGQNEDTRRSKETLTLEQFKADQWGSWYYFVDIDFSRHFVNAAYTEISREINLGKQSPLAAHLEYDGGLNKTGSYQEAGLIGLAYNGHNADYSTTYSAQLMYKQYFKSYDYTRAYMSVQGTGVWSTTFANKACTFSGFIDLWRGEKANGHGQLVLLSEPQLWYNLNTLSGLDKFNLSVGTEVEISNNFVYNPHNDKTFFIIPTVALKWTF